MNKLLLLGCGALLTIAACNSQQSSEEAKAAQEKELSAAYDESLKDKLESFAVLPATAPNEQNPDSFHKIKLGQILYFDKRLSKNNTISCNSCHNLASAGVDNLSFSPGDAGELGGRNSPTSLNAALHKTQFWDGRAKDVEEQAGMPILNPVEMAIPSKDFLVKRLSEITMYKELFKLAFPESTQPLTYDNIAKAIASFERQLLTPSKFDEYLKGNKEALTLQEKRGLLSFINIGCTSCHSGALLGGSSFQKFGVHKNYWEATGSKKIDMGRFDVTKNEYDKYVFKVPSLRNIAGTHPYFHDGSVKDLNRAVEIMANVQLNYAISKEEVENIVAFLKALSGQVPAQYAKAPEELGK